MRTEIKEGFWVAELGRRVRLEASPILLSRQCVIHNISQPCRPPRTVPCIGLLLLWYGDLWGGRDTDPYFHDVDLSSRWMVSFSLRLLHPWENKSHWILVVGMLRCRFERYEKMKFVDPTGTRNSTLPSSIRWLFQRRYLGSSLIPVYMRRE